jgi:hypothetical protein
MPGIRPRVLCLFPGLHSFYVFLVLGYGFPAPSALGSVVATGKQGEKEATAEQREAGLDHRKTV